jgi:hypothetical protein
MQSADCGIFPRRSAEGGRRNSLPDRVKVRGRSLRPGVAMHIRNPQPDIRTEGCVPLTSKWRHPHFAIEARPRVPAFKPEAAFGLRGGGPGDTDQ